VALAAIVSFTLRHSSKRVEKSALAGLGFYWKLPCSVETNLYDRIIYNYS